MLCGDFDRVVVINLPRRADRLGRFTNNVAGIDWPFQPPTVFSAIDARTRALTPMPHRGATATACLLSHRTVWEQALADGVQNLLVFEDDAVFDEDFSEDVQAFLADVPSDWSMLLLGGVHRSVYTPSKRPLLVHDHDRVMRCQHTSGAFAYAMDWTMLVVALQRLRNSRPVDNQMSEWMDHYMAYCPRQFIVGHAPGVSDIDGKVHRGTEWFPLLSDVLKRLTYDVVGGPAKPGPMHIVSVEKFGD